MEHTPMLKFVEIDMKHELVWREYGPLGHNYSPLGAINRFHSDHEPNWLGVRDPVMDAFYPRALGRRHEDELKQVCKESNERVARQHFVISLLQAGHLHSDATVAQRLSRPDPRVMDGHGRTEQAQFIRRPLLDRPRIEKIAGTLEKDSGGYFTRHCCIC